MRESKSSFVDSLSGLTGWSLYCALISTFGLTAYYADLFRRFLPDWVGIGILIAPLVIVVSIQWGELPRRVVSISHLVAAVWFALMSLGMEVGIHLGHEPSGSLFYRVLAHLGWTCAWAGIYRCARRGARRESEDETYPM